MSYLVYLEIVIMRPNKIFFIEIPDRFFFMEKQNLHKIITKWKADLKVYPTKRVDKLLSQISILLDEIY